MSDQAEPAGQVHSWDTNTMPWEIRHIAELDGDLAAKQLIADPLDIHYLHAAQPEADG